jgi:DNA-binding PadR family transcriptional regulator
MTSRKPTIATTKGSAEMLVLTLLEGRPRHGLIAGRWLEKDGERRRRCYRLTPAGHKFLQAQRSSWEEFVATVNRIVRASRA